MGKKRIIHVPVSDYPASWYTTPQAEKDRLYAEKYESMVVSPLTYVDTGEPLEGGNEFMRSLATGMVQAEQGWGRSYVFLHVSKKDHKAWLAGKAAAAKREQAKADAEAQEEELRLNQALEIPETMNRRVDFDISEEPETQLQACDWHTEHGYGWIWDCSGCNPKRLPASSHPDYRSGRAERRHGPKSFPQGDSIIHHDV